MSFQEVLRSSIFVLRTVLRTDFLRDFFSSFFIPFLIDSTIIVHFEDLLHDHIDCQIGVLILDLIAC